MVEHIKPLESIADFVKRAAAHGVRELWVSVGEDENSGLTILWVSPRSATHHDAEQAKAAGIATRKFYAEGDTLIPCDGVEPFSQAVMRSAMTTEQKLEWLYNALQEHEARAVAAEGK